MIDIITQNIFQNTMKNEFEIIREEEWKEKNDDFKNDEEFIIFNWYVIIYY